MTGSASNDKDKDVITDKTIKLYVGGIEGWDGNKIREILSKAGKVIRVDIVKHFSFVFVEDQAEADKILKELHLKVIDGKKLIIQISKNKQFMKDCDDTCFECGQSGHWAKDCEQRRVRLEKQNRTGQLQNDRGVPPGVGRGRMLDDFPNSRIGRHDDYNERSDVWNRGRYPPSSYIRDPVHRDPAREMYRSDLYYRDPYYRENYLRRTVRESPPRSYYVRDPYAREPYAEDLYRRSAYHSERSYYRDRSPTSSLRNSSARYMPADDPYAAAREKLAYGYSLRESTSSKLQSTYEDDRKLPPYESKHTSMERYPYDPPERSAGQYLSQSKSDVPLSAHDERHPASYPSSSSHNNYSSKDYEDQRYLYAESHLKLEEY